MELPTHTTNAAYRNSITRQNIVNFPFPYKLWLVIHMENFLRWNLDGTIILLDFAGLGEYLNSARSIFKIKNTSEFLNLLDEFKFQRLNAAPEAHEDVILQYKNNNFCRHRLDLLVKIRRNAFEQLGYKDIESKEVVKNDESECVNFAASATALAKETAINSSDADRMTGDLCFMFYGCMSNLEKSRLLYQTNLHFQNESRLLMEKLRASDVSQKTKATPGKGRSSMITANTDEIIEIPADLFENPHDSVVNLHEVSTPEYAGYYGNCSKEAIRNFFGDYLPKYQDGTMEIKKVNADCSSTSNNSLAPEPNHITSKPSFTKTFEANSTQINTSAFTPEQQPISNSIYSSGLEPIFKPETNNSKVQQTNQTTNTGMEAELSMAEFLKFKSNSTQIELNELGDKNYYNADLLQRQNQELQSSNTEEHFPQMPAAYKNELNEDHEEKESDFRNFFTQYRESVKLLTDSI